MGNELLSAVVGITQPTHVLHIATDKDKIIPAVHVSEEAFHCHLMRRQRIAVQQADSERRAEEAEEGGSLGEVTPVKSAGGNVSDSSTGSSHTSKAARKRARAAAASAQYVPPPVYPYDIITLQPGRTVQSRVAAVDLRNLR